MRKIDMETALALLGIRYPAGKTSFYIECPFCSNEHKSKRKTMNINLSKGEGGVFSCLRCNKQGHVVTLWRELKGFSSNKDAAKDIQKAIGNEDNAPVIKKTRKYVEQEPPIAPIEVRDATYNALLDSLTLADMHEADLRKRGLSASYIKRKKYRSVPQSSLKEIANMILDKGLILDGVPGFYKNHEEWSLVYNSSGILIPQRNGFGQIQGFQIRMDNPTHGKYINLTSNNKPAGTASKTYAHMAYNLEEDVSEVILTEGALKADVIAYLGNKSVIAIPGVNSTKYLPQALYDLKQKGLKKLCIAFDMDMYDNPNVYRAYCKIKDIIRKTDIPFCKYEWPAEYKGLDDYFNARR